MNDDGYLGELGRGFLADVIQELAVAGHLAGMVGQLGLVVVSGTCGSQSVDVGVDLVTEDSFCLECPVVVRGEVRDGGSQGVDRQLPFDVSDYCCCSNEAQAGVAGNGHGVEAALKSGTTASRAAEAVVIIDRARGIGARGRTFIVRLQSHQRSVSCRTAEIGFRGQTRWRTDDERTRNHAAKGQGDHAGFA